MPRALLSVSDKTGIVDLGRGLADLRRGLAFDSSDATARDMANRLERVLRTGTGRP